ncbi:hypothetical protein GJAV_G00080070, partial [Gymnothorax javanicus]
MVSLKKLYRYGGFSFGQPLPTDLKMDLLDVPLDRALTMLHSGAKQTNTPPPRSA